MPNSFDILSFLIADYVSQDTKGRWNFVGVYSNGIEYSQFIPEYFPQFNLVIITRPKQKDFKVIVTIESPNGKEVFRDDNDVIGNMEPPADAKFLRVFQLPPSVPLDGSGNYLVNISDESGDKNVIMVLPINVRKDLATSLPKKLTD